MGYAEATMVIHAPIDVVWHSLNDIDHTPEWVIGLENAEIVSSGAYGLGSVYNDYNRLGSFPQVTEWHVTAFEPLTNQVHVSTSKVLPTTMRLSLAPASEGTRLRMIVEYRFLPRLGILSQLFERAVMNRLLSSVVKQNQRNLDAYLTAKTSAAPAPALG
jgi:uncharacterized protein YndB with AHSA1/START domain